jgi:2-C-methyl-D-erythritol 2,4-cyclodiphosphate synthase
MSAAPRFGKSRARGPSLPLALHDAYHRSSMRQRFGIGYDSHTFGAARPLVLAGVAVPHDSGLQGHSDGDAVAHAIIDALLGAAALGDIGTLFPDTDPRWKDANSLVLLEEVRRRVVAASYAIVNVDATVITERPRLAPHIAAMRQNVAHALSVAVSAVSIKAKTNEGMDAVGRGEGLQVLAIAALGDA